MLTCTNYFEGSFYVSPGLDALNTNFESYLLKLKLISFFPSDDIFGEGLEISSLLKESPLDISTSEVSPKEGL